MNNLSGSSNLMAKLLARENIEIVSGNYKTAFFDMKNRVLGIPIWGVIEKDVQDLIIAHEVGHALYSPLEGWHNAISVLDIPKPYLNVIEDIRIEKKIIEKYPGFFPVFKRGYVILNQNNFFGLEGKNINRLSFMDRVNIKSKLRDGIEIYFSDEELHYFNLALSVETWEDVLSVCKELLDFVKRNNLTKPVTSISDPDGDFLILSDQKGDQNGIDSDEFFENPKDIESDREEKDDQDKEDLIDPNEEDISYSNDDAESIFTDNQFRQNETRLSNYDPDFYLLNGFNQLELQKILVDFEKIKEGREQIKNIYSEFLKRFNNDDQFNEFFNETKKLVEVMSKEFEMKKAASQYMKSSTSKSGTLDPLKICNYKFSDDIFKTITNLKDSKNHGMIILVDYSQSMTSVMNRVIKQILILSTFCKKVGIPFEVYGFTSLNIYRKKEDNAVNRISTNDIRLFNLLSSSLKNSEYALAFRQLFNQTYSDNVGSPSGRRVFCSSYEELGGTPLNEVLTGMPFIIEKFISKNKTEKNIFTIITDGESRKMSKKFKVSVRMNDGFIVKGNTFELTEKLILRVTEMFNLISLGYFIPSTPNKKDLESKLKCTISASRKTRNVHKNDEDLILKKKEITSNKFVSFDNVYGFNKYFILSPDMEGFDLKKNDFSVDENSKGFQVRRAFIKYTNSKKINRIFASQFAKTIS